MITYTFILKDTNSQTSPVFLAIRGNGRRLKISTGLTVQTDAWDKDNFQMTRKSPFHKTENAVLLRWKNAAETAVREAENRLLRERHFQDTAVSGADSAVAG